MCYQTLDEAIFHEGLSSRHELVEMLSSRFSTYNEMPDDDLLELANRHRSEKKSLYPDRIAFNDPIDW
jgi:hypothetical protein